MPDTITAKSLAEALGVSKQAVMKRANQNNWPYENGGNRVKRFRVSALPSDIQTALATNMDMPLDMIPVLAPEAALEAAKRMMPEASIYKGIANSVPSWTEGTAIGMDVLRDPKVQKWARICQEAMDAPAGWKKRKWIEAVAIKHNTTFQTIYRKLAKYKKSGLTGLHHTKSTRNQPRSWTPEAVDWWIGLVLKREHRKIAKDALYAILDVEARKNGWEIGGYRSALWWLEKRVSPQLLSLQRGGTRALDNTLPPVLRDYSDLAPFEILVGDQHKWDFWVTDEESGEVFRPEGYFWQDLRTRCLYGGALDKKYDSYLIGLALRMGLRVFGSFDSIYTDNGKPELSRYVMGIMRDMRTLGLNVHGEVDVPLDDFTCDAEEVNPLAIMPGSHRKAIVRNAKAKMIEGTFNVLEAIMRDHFHLPGYVKKLGGPGEENDVDEHEKDRLARAGKLPTFWEFAETLFKAMDYYNSQKPHRGVLKEWGRPKPKSATPMDCLRACYSDGWRPVFLSEAATDLVFMARASRIVDRGRITFRKMPYEHDALVRLHKQKVDVRFDPMDMESILVFMGETFVCRAEPVEYSSMKDTELASRKIEEKRRMRKGFILEYRRFTSAIPDFREFSKTPAIEKAAALVGAEIHAQGAKQRELAETYRVKTSDEIDAEVASLEAYTERRPIFTRRSDRYEWCMDQQAQGLNLLDEDLAFMAEMEAGMNPDTLEYWQTFREGLGIEAAGGHL